MTWTLSAFTDEAGASPEEQIQACKDNGLNFIDPRSVDEHNIVNLPVDEAEAFKKMLDNEGIGVHMYGSPIGKIGVNEDLQIDLDRLDHLAKMRDVFGCNTVRMFSYFNKTNLSKDEWGNLAMDRLKKLRDHAGKLDLVLYHENESHIFGDYPDDVARIADELRGENFKLIYDFANYIRTGVNGWSTWQMFKDQTDLFHFKDQKLTGEHMPMAEGDTDARRIIEDAAKSGWSGGCTIEPHLKFSDAVAATGVSGSGSSTLKELAPAQTFGIAAQASKSLLDELEIDYR
jgi:sugar phosphate isomerase/epimerase